MTNFKQFLLNFNTQKQWIMEIVIKKSSIWIKRSNLKSTLEKRAYSQNKPGAPALHQTKDKEFLNTIEYCSLFISL